jgi:hypothetical protein
LSTCQTIISSSGNQLFGEFHILRSFIVIGTKKDK